MSDEEWGTTEARALHRLEAHGVRVPIPVMSYEGVLLMELVKDAEGHPAPRLIEVRYEPEEARAAYLDLRSQIVKMLCAEIVHGDLSAYNILAAEAGPTIIDFPQIVSPAGNSRAEFFFLRDYRNVYDFFAGFDRSLSASWEDGRQIWSAYRRRELTPEFVPSHGRARVERTFQPPPQRSHEGAPQRPRDFDAPRPPPPRRPYDARPPQPRPQNPQRPYEAQLPPRPQGGPRPQNGPRPHDGPRRNDGPRPQHNGPRPQNGPRPPQNGPRPPQGPPAKPDDAPPPLRSVRSRPKAYTSPDLPPRGVKRSEDKGPPGGASHRRPKRRF
jgi:RIO kinase 1